MNDYLACLEKYNPNIRSILGNNVKHNLKIIYKFSQERKEKIYLVGGIVRDILLGRNSKDIDLVLKGNSQEFALSLLPKLKPVKHRYTERFLTYNIFTNSGTNIDIASFREETYSYPGALPSVIPADLENDYIRRDFTINSMYISFDEKAELYDPLNAMEDLKNGIIKIIHEKSFEDDPTRIFRAVKFAARYNFSLEEKTEQLLKKAVDNNFLDTISYMRLKNEIYTLLTEKNLRGILKYFRNYNIFKYLNIPNPSDEKIEELLRIVHSHYFLQAKEEFKISRGNFIIFYLLKEVSYKEKINAVKFFEFSEKVLNNFIFTDEEKSEIMKKLSACTKKSEIYKTLKFVSPFKMLYLYFTEKENRSKIKTCLFKLISKNAIISGSDLLEMGFANDASMKENLEHCFSIQLDMENPDKEKIIEKFIEELKYDRNLQSENSI